ncbi:MAG: DUF3303 domain-containing protein [Alphaproteobacteria bacterium]
MLFMVIERFKDCDALPAYRRFRDRGRMLPEGMVVHDSWTEANCDRCFMIVECDDVTSLQLWTAQWRDLVEIEFVPVVSGKDTAAAFAPLLEDGGAGRGG